MTAPRTEPIDVVCLWLIREGKILVVQRGPEAPHADAWEFPGGKVESGESPGTAIRREIEEELGIWVQPVLPLDGIVHEYPHICIRLIPVLCTWQEGEICLHEHTALCWAGWSDLDMLPFAAADKELIRQHSAMLEKMLRKSDS